MSFDLPYEIVNEEGKGAFLFLCEHASNRLPAEYGTLGVSDADRERHIAWDIGAGDIVRTLSQRLDCPAVLGRYSRLLIDLNRDVDDPTIIMRLSDGAIVPGNRHANQAEIDCRIAKYHAPYHGAVDELIDAKMAREGNPPILISVHSFTPTWKGEQRPWHVGVLWDRDARVPKHLLREFHLQKDIVVGDNEPYSGELAGDSLYTHGTCRGIPHALLEIRQDLIDTPEGVQEWADHLVRALRPVAIDRTIREISYQGSHADDTVGD